MPHDLALYESHGGGALVPQSTGLVASAAFMDRWVGTGQELRITSPRGTNTVRCETAGDEHVVVVSDRTVREA